jgi:hypothetical protein
MGDLALLIGGIVARPLLLGAGAKAAGGEAGEGEGKEARAGEGAMGHGSIPAKLGVRFTARKLNPN